MNPDGIDAVLAGESDGHHDYKRFVSSKRLRVDAVGRPCSPEDCHHVLFSFQRDITAWAVRRGRCAIFADTGLGKTMMQLEWARLLGERTLIIAPLSVARQTVWEARDKLGLDVVYARQQSDAGNITITNYEMAGEFDPAEFGAVVLDESSILKSLTGKTRRKLTTMFADTPYRLCCTATPAPNDHVELGNHAHFLGICSAAEMQSLFFINANKEHIVRVGDEVIRRKGSNKGGTEWRLKHNAEEPFFEWLSTWACMLTKPSDLGYDDDGYVLPGLDVHEHYVQSKFQPDGMLFFTKLKGVGSRARLRSETIPDRLAALCPLLDNGEQWIVWCGLNAEADAVCEAVHDAEQVRGADSSETKAAALERFQDGDIRVLVTKPKIAGFGMNFQNACHMAFFGLNDSWETWYQCIRREYRYGQTRPVQVHVVLSDLEREIFSNIQRKERLASRLRSGLVKRLRVYETKEIGMRIAPTVETSDRIERGELWQLRLGDSCERLGELEDESIDLSVYSPPFADLFTYSDSPRDLGNCRDWGEFFEHYEYLIQENLRVTKPGRLACVHTSDIAAMQSRDGYIGVKDFPGEVVRAYERCGWTFVGRAFVQKNPQAQAIRVKSKALLFVQLRKDSSDCRPALIDQVLMFRRPGENKVPVRPVENGEMDNETWIEWAHGIWLGIHETDTLQYSHARAADDEKHICPLQLGTIERCVKLYSNPGELVLSPFAGIGSEGYVAVKHGRRFTGIELKPSYFEVGLRHLAQAEREALAGSLFQVEEASE